MRCKSFGFLIKHKLHQNYCAAQSCFFFSFCFSCNLFRHLESSLQILLRLLMQQQHYLWPHNCTPAINKSISMENYLHNGHFMKIFFFSYTGHKCSRLIFDFQINLCTFFRLFPFELSMYCVCINDLFDNYQSVEKWKYFSYKKICRKFCKLKPKMDM